VHQRSVRRRRSVVRRRPDEASAADANPGPATIPEPRYPIAGPAVRLGGAAHDPGRAAATSGPSAVPAIHGTGTARRDTAYGGSVRLQGRTDADFNGGDFHTEKGRTRPATGCAGCGADDCIRATGKLVIDFRAPTRVTLPHVSDFPNLTPCQVRRVQAAITNVLAPHEQRHVRAFSRYDGTVTRSFDLTLCRDAFDSRIQSMVEAIEQPRRATAQAASDALDPFFFDVDIDCTEPPPSTKPAKKASLDPATPEPGEEPA
jgi:hypothetical protein